ncbi:ROK family transcriptional regulator [Sediminibacillus halophilus]|uniref:Sugar kinase of the NBD/HSP70 family, may contain an N-terminal HTH domain n=1 Tax=Sediminibacillus halophilus TaxID=482461 RepID=A0A1G9T2A6_9BACI|nr:ROK family transcriptional regulator [Sediminibacillus halophilus]SDM41863.1 Sugar kinase of the NBD/HSP70 family, may contain an N-terminal HTH domain [Sediminibacillus halophilus]
MASSSTAGSAEEMKRQNRSFVLQALRKASPVSNAELARHTGLSIMSISTIIKELQAIGLVETSGSGESQGGRKPLLYQLHQQNYVISVAIHVDNIQTAKINPQGKIVQVEKKSVCGQLQQNEWAALVCDLIDQLLENSADKAEVMGIAVSAPGPVDVDTGTLLNPPNIKAIEQWEVGALLEERYRLPVVLERDANAAALGEHWFGSSEKKSSMLYVFADQGIGGGIIFQGKVYRGFLNGAGEIGHHTIDMDGPKCSCGSYGCLEALASGIAMTKKAETLQAQSEALSAEKQQITLEKIFAAAESGEPLAMQLLEESANYLGVGIANAANILNPEEIIIGGAIVHGYPAAMETISYLVNDRILYNGKEPMIIKRSQFKEEAQLVGAAAVILDHLFSNPQLLMK